MFTISGAHTPVTMNGNIVVEGVLASYYAFSDHDLGHLATTPFRLFPDIVEMILGNDNGSPAYANIITTCGNYLLPYVNI